MLANSKVLRIESIPDLSEGEYIRGICLFQSCSKSPTKNGGFYFGGKLSTSEGFVDYKAWSNSAAYATLETGDFTGKICSIVAKINEYGGVKSLILQEVVEESIEELKKAGLTEYDFMFSKYNVEAYWNKFVGLLEKNVSPDAMWVFNKIIGDVETDFKNEFAAVHYHDACRGGLLAHTMKVTQCATLCKLYHNILKRISADVLFVGCALHDIGKVYEYKNGAISDMGKIVSHPVLGVGILSGYESEICNKMGEKFYLDLISIVSSHHGDCGEPPRTVGAYVVHVFDYMESRLTGLDEMLEQTQEGQISYDGYKLM